MVVVVTPNEHTARPSATELHEPPPGQHLLAEPTVVPMLKPAPVETPDW
jgi:hypothetical protein